MSLSLCGFVFLSLSLPVLGVWNAQAWVLKFFWENTDWFQKFAWTAHGSLLVSWLVDVGSFFLVCSSSLTFSNSLVVWSSFLPCSSNLSCKCSLCWAFLFVPGLPDLPDLVPLTILSQSCGREIDDDIIILSSEDPGIMPSSNRICSENRWGAGDHTRQNTSF